MKMQCVVCGKKTENKMMICARCMKEKGIIGSGTLKEIKNMQDVAEVIGIEEGNDTATVKAVESMLRIADNMKKERQSDFK